MKALMYSAFDSPPEVLEIATPEPGPGEVRVKISAAGACHTDSFIMGLRRRGLESMGMSLPVSLGHEGVGLVDKLGDGVSEFEIGDAVAIYGPRGCGRCDVCVRGEENHCSNGLSLGFRSPGLGAPGTMAEYIVVPHPRYLLPLGPLDPVQAVALTDAGLTPYHAIKSSLPKLRAGTAALVIGVGGLGHVAIQLLRALTPAVVIAVDLNDEKLALAEANGAQHGVIAGSDAAMTIRELVGSMGVTVVLDFVVTQPTVDLGAAVLGINGDLVLVGLGAVSRDIGLLAMPRDSTIRVPYWGSPSELAEVLDLARAGLVNVETEVFSLDEAPEAYRRLHEGSLRGRAVVVPGWSR